MLKSFIIDNMSIDMRLDRWIRDKIGKIPQGLIEKDLRKGNIKLNNKKAKGSTKLRLNDKIDFFKFDYQINPTKEKKKFVPSKKILSKNEGNIIENNLDFIVINKDSGISVQGGTKSRRNLIDIYGKSEIFKDSKPYTVHRLDKDTSGILIIAKNRSSAQLLTSLFRLRKVHKTYLAICYGEVIKNNGQLIDNLVRYDNNKKIVEKAITHFKVLDKNLNYSLLELKPITGRKHQIRKQLYNIGHPIVGDQKYNIEIFSRSMNKNLMLHSYKIKFMINKIKFNYKAPIPAYFEKFINSKKIKFLNI